MLVFPVFLKLLCLLNMNKISHYIYIFQISNEQANKNCRLVADQPYLNAQLTVFGFLNCEKAF